MTDFSRGNPGASGSQDSDIKGVEKQSPVNPRSFNPISIENCADLGVGANVGVSFFYIMGQEDKYRHDGDKRIVRGGTARITVSTNVRTDIDIEYVANPPNPNNPTFQESRINVSKGRREHEFFFPVNLSTLYAFRITAKASDYPKSQTSGIHYFQTADTLTLILDQFGNGSDSTTTLKETLPYSSLSVSSKNDGFYKEKVTPSDIVVFSSVVDMQVESPAAVSNKTQEAKSFFTDYTINQP